MHRIPLEEYWILGRSITIPVLSNQALSQLLFSAWVLLPCVSQEEIKNYISSVWYFTLIWDMLQVITLCVVTQMLQRSVDLLYVLLHGHCPQVSKGEMTSRTALGSMRHFSPSDNLRLGGQNGADLLGLVTLLRDTGALGYGLSPTVSPQTWAPSELLHRLSLTPIPTGRHKQLIVPRRWEWLPRKWQVIITSSISSEGTQSSHPSSTNSTFTMSAYGLWDLEIIVLQNFNKLGYVCHAWDG